jgi:hypothetical protein
MEFYSGLLRRNKSRVVGCSVVSESWVYIVWIFSSSFPQAQTYIEEVLILEIRGERSSILCVCVLENQRRVERLRVECWERLSLCDFKRSSSLYCSQHTRSHDAMAFRDRRRAEYVHVFEFREHSLMRSSFWRPETNSHQMLSSKF